MKIINEISIISARKKKHRKSIDMNDKSDKMHNKHN